MSTAIWLPFFASKSASLASMRLTAPPDNVPVRSVTRAVSGGTATSALATSAARPATTLTASRDIRSLILVRRCAGRGRCGGWGRCAGRRRRREIHGRRLGNRRFVLDGEIRLLLVAELHRRQIGGERSHRDVVVLYRLDVAVARHGDAILRALELGLQIAE